MAKLKIRNGANYDRTAKESVCIACNGSGYYDDHGSPKCDACDGTGKDLSRVTRMGR
jgi:DnaJ-class molecular chaperone